MKKFIVTLLSITISLLSFGQDTIVFKVKHDSIMEVKLWTKYPGFVITKKGDTIKGYLMLKNLISNQDKVFFYKTENTDKKEAVKYKPKDLLAYKVGPRYYESFKFWPSEPTYVTNNTRGYHFILRIIDGPISLYRWYYEPVSVSEQRVHISFENPASTHVDLSFYEGNLYNVPLVKKYDKDIIFLKSGFRKNMLKLVSDYPELAKKIENKVYGWDDLDIIVREYNEWFLKNHPDWKKN
jgi:hypothetical protein